MLLTKDELTEVFSEYNPKLYAGRDLKINCPACGKRECFVSIYKENHLGQCWRKNKCELGGFNIFQLAKAGYIQLNYVQNYSPILSNLSSFEKEEKKSFPEPLKLGKEFRRIYTHPYLQSRGVGSQQTMKYPFYTHLFNSAYIYAGIEMKGKNRGYLGRLLYDSDELPKYENGKGQDFECLIYGYDEITENTKHVFIVEGFFDKLRVDTLLNLYDSEEIKCVSTFGAKISDFQIGLLSNIKTIHLLYEWDVLKVVMKVSATLSNYFPCVNVYEIRGNDPGAMNRKELLEILYKPMSFLDVNYNYI